MENIMNNIEPSVVFQPPVEYDVKYCVVKSKTIVIIGGPFSDDVLYDNALKLGYSKDDVELLSEKDYLERVKQTADVKYNNIDNLKSLKNNELNIACTNTIYSRFKSTVNGIDYEFSYDSEAQKRFNGIGTLIYAGKIPNIEWTAYLNNERTRITLDSASFEIVAMDALKHQNDNIVKFNTLTTQVSKATTKEEIDAIVWSS